MPPYLYTQTKPDKLLSDYIHSYWRFRHTFQVGESQAIYPDSYYELIWTQKGTLKVDGVPAPCLLLGGFSSKPLTISADGELDLRGVRFNAWGLVPFCDPAAVGNGVFVSAEQVFGPAAYRDLVAIFTSATPETLTDALDAFFVQRLAAERRSDAQLIAVSLGFGANDVARVEAIAQMCNVSMRQLERIVRKATGKTPKALAMRLRFERARRELQAGASLSEVANSCGYSDQSHLINEFQRFTGMTPSQYRNSIIQVAVGAGQSDTSL